MFNIDNLEVTGKYGGDLPLSHHPEKAMANILLYFFLVLSFFCSAYSYVHTFLNGPSWKSHKENAEKCHSPL